MASATSKTLRLQGWQRESRNRMDGAWFYDYPIDPLIPCGSCCGRRVEILVYAMDASRRCQGLQCWALGLRLGVICDRVFSVSLELPPIGMCRCVALGVGLAMY